MKVIEIVTTHLLLAVVCVRALVRYEVLTDDVKGTKEDEDFTKLFDKALAEYKNLICNHSDRTVLLEDVTVSFDTKLKHHPKGEVQLFNGSFRDLYTLERLEPVVVMPLDRNHVLTSALLRLEHFFLLYDKYIAKLGDMEFSFCFISASYKNQLRIGWNVTMGETPAVDVYRVDLEAAWERIYYMPEFGKFPFMENRAGKAVVDRFMEVEKYKVDEAIKRHFKEAVIRADIAAQLVKYLS